MELAHRDASLSWRASWASQVQEHPYTALGLAVALAAVVLLLDTTLG